MKRDSITLTIAGSLVCLVVLVGIIAVAVLRRPAPAEPQVVRFMSQDEIDKADGEKLRKTDIYRAAIKKVLANKFVTDELGKPIEHENGMILGKIEPEKIWMIANVVGSKRKGSFSAEGKLVNGMWEIVRLTVQIHDVGDLSLLNDGDAGSGSLIK